MNEKVNDNLSCQKSSSVKHTSSARSALMSLQPKLLQNHQVRQSHSVDVSTDCQNELLALTFLNYVTLGKFSTSELSFFVLFW